MTKRDSVWMHFQEDLQKITNTLAIALNVEKSYDKRNMVDYRTQVYYGDTAEDDREDRKDSRLECGRNTQWCTPIETNIQASCPNKISVSGGLTGENTVENHAVHLPSLLL